MFNGTYEQRLFAWNGFRNSLETSETPIQDVIDIYNKAPKVLIHADPYDKQTWPTPWELVNENSYCEFCLMLGICYTLQLTDRFSTEHFEIHIRQDKERSETRYLLFLKDLCIGYDEHAPVSVEDLPETLRLEKKYVMPDLQ